MHNDRLYLIFERNRYLPFKKLNKLGDNTVVHVLVQIIVSPLNTHSVQFFYPPEDTFHYSIRHKFGYILVIFKWLSLCDSDGSNERDEVDLKNINPAYAGKTGRLQSLLIFCWDHPRIRGKDIYTDKYTF